MRWRDVRVWWLGRTRDRRFAWQLAGSEARAERDEHPFGTGRNGRPLTTATSWHAEEIRRVLHACGAKDYETARRGSGFGFAVESAEDHFVVSWTGASNRAVLHQELTHYGDVLRSVGYLVDVFDHPGDLDVGLEVRLPMGGPEGPAL